MSIAARHGSLHILLDKHDYGAARRANSKKDRRSAHRANCVITSVTEAFCVASLEVSLLSSVLIVQVLI